MGKGLITFVVCASVCVTYRTCVHVSRVSMTYGRAQRAHEEGQHQDRLVEVIGVTGISLRRKVHRVDFWPRLQCFFRGC